MKLTMEVISDQQASMGDDRSYTCDESGGSIGRGCGNTWVLPDPDHYVSSRHAEIRFSDGRFGVTDISTNGVFVNGAAAPLGRDRQAVLSDGDRLVVGEYEIAVRLQDGIVRAPAPASAGGGPTTPGGAGARARNGVPDIAERHGAESRSSQLKVPTAPFPTPEADPTDRTVGVQPASTSPIIPDDADFTIEVPEQPVPASPPPQRTPAAAPGTKDLDAMLPDSPSPRPPAKRPLAPEPPGIVGQPPLRPGSVDRWSAPGSAGAAAPTLLADDDLHDLAAKPVAGAVKRPRESMLPESVPLIRPVSGTGNRPEPLSPASATGSAAQVRHTIPGRIAHRGDRTAPATARSSNHRAAGPLVTALAAGLGLDRHVIEEMEPREIVALAGCAARAAKLGIEAAVDARNTLVRTVGLDPGVLEQESDNPFLVFRSGEAALTDRLAGRADMTRSLAAATRCSSATLAAGTTAMAAVFDRFETDAPPRSADEVRAMFLELYNWEASRST